MLKNVFFLFFRRRSPKKTPQKQKNSIDEETEKLSQEAFRLLRTAQNLLNLKNATLSESKAITATTTASHRNSLTDLKSACCNNGLSSPASSTSLLYASSLQRKIKTRDSRISFQSNSSTTDGSVHSNSSSSRQETDEDNPLLSSSVNGVGITACHANNTSSSSSSTSSSSSSSSSSCSNHLNLNHNTKFNLPNEMDALSLRKDRVKSVTSCHSAEDESGFSSLNSFHQDNLPATTTTTILPPPPLNSTMISNQFFLDGNDDPPHIIGIPPTSAYETKSATVAATVCLPITHKRWDSAPPLPPKKNLSTFHSIEMTNNNNNGNEKKPAGIHVLWV